MTTVSRIVTIIFFIALCAVIVVMDIAKDNVFLRVTSNIPHADKLSHFLLFGMLTFLVNISLPHKKIRFIPLGSLLVFIFSILEEASQFFIETRNFDLVDLTSNFLGIWFFTILSTKWISKFSIQKEKSSPAKLTFEDFKVGKN